VIALAAIIAVVASLALTGLARSYAVRRQLVDVPNSRSSHARPVPRGGGIGFVVTFSAALVALAAVGLVPLEPAVAILGAGAAVAAIGFADDHGHVSVKARVAVHALAAVWVLYWLRVEPEAAVGAADWPGWLGGLLAVLFVVWLLNLYNFMDGIDGLASIEAVTAAAGGAWLAFAVVPGSDLWLLPLFLAAAVAGFLFWNMPPARIFMGDVGSGFLGVCLAAFALHSLTFAPALFWSWTILLGVFIVDATLTLLKRIAHGRTFYEAHRSHAYQHAARRFGHMRVSVAVGLLNILWLLPIAWLAATGRLAGPVGLAVAYLPLLAAALYFRAGSES
jgi:Fuc2NAc and GlcNAc transferase